MRMSLAESRLGLVDSNVCSTERLCESEYCCLGHRRKVVPCVCSIRVIAAWTTLLLMCI